VRLCSFDKARSRITSTVSLYLVEHAVDICSYEHETVAMNMYSDRQWRQYCSTDETLKLSQPFPDLTAVKLV
jgi:hypothetical protein